MMMIKTTMMMMKFQNYIWVRSVAWRSKWVGLETSATETSWKFNFDSRSLSWDQTTSTTFQTSPELKQHTKANLMKEGSVFFYFFKWFKTTFILSWNFKCSSINWEGMTITRFCFVQVHCACVDARQSHNLRLVHKYRQGFKTNTKCARLQMHVPRLTAP